MIAPEQADGKFEPSLLSVKSPQRCSVFIFNYSKLGVHRGAYWPRLNGLDLEAPGDQVQSGSERLQNVNFFFPAQAYALHTPPRASEPLTLLRRRPSPPGIQEAVGPGDAPWEKGKDPRPRDLSPGTPGSHVPGPPPPRASPARAPRLRGPVRILLQPDDGPRGAPSSRRAATRARGAGAAPQPAAQMARQPRAGTFSQAFKESTFFPA